jgi:hypothetical protein
VDTSYKIARTVPGVELIRGRQGVSVYKGGGWEECDILELPDVTPAQRRAFSRLESVTLTLEGGSQVPLKFDGKGCPLCGQRGGVDRG